MVVGIVLNGTVIEGQTPLPVDLAACPGPEPFILNSNSFSALLSSDRFNGTQPEHAGNYTCHVNGVPRSTVEIVVLGKI